YVEGELFAASRARSHVLFAPAREQAREFGSFRRPAAPDVQAPDRPPRRRRTTSQRVVRTALVALPAILITASAVRWAPSLRVPAHTAVEPPTSTSRVVVVRPAESIAEALGRAQPGSQIVVEPGEYRERLVLKHGVRVVSRVPRGAAIRLPGTVADTDPAIGDDEG